MDTNIMHMAFLETRVYCIYTNRMDFDYSFYYKDEDEEKNIYLKTNNKILFQFYLCLIN
jgi:hypothetical protein